MCGKSRFLLATVLGAIAPAALPTRKAVAAEANFFITHEYAIKSSVRGCPNEAEFQKSRSSVWRCIFFARNKGLHHPSRLRLLTADARRT
jgi:hypothetical protein